MMLPALMSAKEKATSAKAFYGIDRRENAALGSFYEAVNVTGDSYPALCTGDGWVTRYTVDKPKGLYRKGRTYVRKTQAIRAFAGFPATKSGTDSRKICAAPIGCGQNKTFSGEFQKTVPFYPLFFSYW